jgi:uncharacterized membrane protein YeaQ/YmgE (transglycosylase-associated protein family)
LSIIAWIVFGFLAGATARLATPGRHPRGCLVTVVVGIAGAVVGGLAGYALLGKRIGWSFSLRPFLVAVAGAIVVLLVLRAIEGRRER